MTVTGSWYEDMLGALASPPWEQGWLPRGSERQALLGAAPQWGWQAISTSSSCPRTRIPGTPGLEQTATLGPAVLKLHV